MGPGLRRGDLSRVLRYNRRAMNNSLRLCLMFRMRYVTIALILCAALSRAAFAAAAEPATDPQIDPAPCVAAASAGDDDKVIAVCGALVDSEKTPAPDRIKALIARASAFARKDQIDRAISDYDTALRLDPTLADIFNTRGELWRKKGDRPKALADFGAAIKLNPQHEAARANYKSLALELERIGAQMAIKDKPNPKSSPPLKPGRPLK
jgi:tetratricopeptide (TPR) repeat protein